MIEGENVAKKPDSMKSDQEKKDEGIEVGSGKAYKVVIGVLFVLILVAGGYLVWTRMSGDDGTTETDNETVDNSGSVTQQQYDQLNAQLTTCQAELIVAENCEVGEGSKVKKDVELGSYVVSFEHPDSYYHLSGWQSIMESNDNGYDIYYPLGIDYQYDDMEFGEEVFLITNRSMEVYPEVSEDYNEIEIGGEKYTIRKLSNGDGSFGSRSFTYYYEVKLEDDLFMSYVAKDELASVDCSLDTNDNSGLPSCEDPDLETEYEYKTSDEQIEVGLEVLRSFTYERK